MFDERPDLSAHEFYKTKEYNEIMSKFAKIKLPKIETIT